MGDIARTSRAERFIKEFNEDWVKKKGYQFHELLSQGLGYDEYCQVVRHYILLESVRGDKEEFMSPLEIYGPEGDDCETLAECLAEWLEGTKEEMIERLKKVDLWR